MATFFIYCPCKVRSIGIGLLTGDFAYIAWERVKDGRWPCKFCGAQLRFVGDSPGMDKVHKVNAASCDKAYRKWRDEQKEPDDER